VHGRLVHGCLNHSPLWKRWKVFFWLQTLSKTSVDEVFTGMHQFEKISSASGGIPTGELPLDSAGGLQSFRPHHCPPLEKIVRVPMFYCCVLFSSTISFRAVISTILVLSVLMKQFCYLLFVTACICIDKYINYAGPVKPRVARQWNHLLLCTA